MNMQSIHKCEQKITNQKLHHVFAYGSNLNPMRLRSRIQNWDGSYQLASLPGYELRFNMFAEQQRVGANIVPHPTRHVRGIIIQLDEIDLFELDKYEGHPILYQRVEVKVNLDNTSRMNAYTYVAQPQWITEGLLPTVDYLEHIINGASVCGLPADYIQAIQKLGTILRRN
ncbi:MAG: gamma-glutamylcyclotransferase [Chlorogloeopsis fritschii C42_A2020_084]|uniref:gamma-glutamylcyclotransferase family protein n=1 Tax=Chlorogloeopsis fritschii TaxID=1124 RepID=UPI001A097E21|nr:gamma-glutamylcyclotransferase family protein [Chlorogloeopsis fritschii]MBF2005276.1 gamma-glutamylcyclotransferase [Chlorogloeopsis fritschii C42_A2020_084]